MGREDKSKEKSRLRRRRKRWRKRGTHLWQEVSSEQPARRAEAVKVRIQRQEREEAPRQKVDAEKQVNRKLKELARNEPKLDRAFKTRKSLLHDLGTGWWPNRKSLVHCPRFFPSSLSTL